MQAKLLIFLVNLLPCIASSLKNKTSCPLTEVNAYAYGCNMQGQPQTPVKVGTVKNITAAEDCASLCLDIKACKSFRYIAESQKCQLYKKSLDTMEFTHDVSVPGIFYDRSCFTRDCNIIDSCKAVESCSPFICDNGLDETFQTEFGCSYGRTMTVPGINPNETLLDGTLTLCDAAVKCATPPYYFAKFGPFFLGYLTQAQMWHCIYWHTSAPDYDSEEQLRAWEHISDTTLSIKNSSYGTTYGFYTSAAFYGYYSATCYGKSDRRFKI